MQQCTCMIVRENMHFQIVIEVTKFTVNRFHLVPYINHNDIHNGRETTINIRSHMPVEVNNQAMIYTLDTGA